MYDARVIEIPTPRWTIYDAKALGLDPRARLVVADLVYARSETREEAGLLPGAQGVVAVSLQAGVPSMAGLGLEGTKITETHPEP